MNEKNEMMIPDEVIMSKIMVVRGVKVMIDNDLAELYGVTTKRLNEQVKRNIKRFPEDFMFQLTAEEKQEVVARAKTVNIQIVRVFSRMRQLLDGHATQFD